MTTRPVVIGASAGGVDAMLQLAHDLPAGFPAPIFLVVHIPSDAPSIFPNILARHGPLSAKHGEDGERYRNGVIYVAPPDRHMLLDKHGKLRVVRGPRENRHRPAVDPLFRSAAVAEGSNVIGVILSGALDDGTAGLLAIKRAGGIAVVQDPRDAIYPSMPANAMEHVAVDHILPLSQIAAKLGELVSETAPNAKRDPDGMKQMEFETRITAMDGEAMEQDDRPGNPSAFSCPDCGGVLWEIADGELSRFRCRVGHAYSPEAMLGAQADVLEEALWTAMKTLEESARLSKRLALQERERGHAWMAKRFEGREHDSRERAEAIRRFLQRDTSETPVEIPAGERPQ